MRLAIGCDHRGLVLKQALVKFLAEAGHECEDVGCFNSSPVDYPDIAHRVAEMITQDKSERGILICSTGIGMSISANKIKGMRAALCHNVFTARRARQHNDANVLCLGQDVVEQGAAEEIVNTFLTYKFENGRHICRLDKIAALENQKPEDTKG